MKLRWIVLMGLLATTTWGKGKPGGGGGPPPDPAIVYTRSSASGSSDLMVMNADGSNQRVVLAAAGDSYMTAAWSPDGSRIVFGGTVQGDGLYVIDVDGTGLTKIYDGVAGGPAWSPVPAPDGSYRIAFHDGDLDLWVVSPDGSGLLNLTSTASVREWYPTWSPDATRIAAAVNHDPASTSDIGDEVFVFDLGVDGAGQLEITASVDVTEGTPLQSLHVMDPDWARAADRLAVAAVPVDGGSRDIWVIDLANPSAAANVTQTSRREEVSPTWSPDDGRIALSTGAIAAINPDGSGFTTLANGQRLRAPDWRR